MRVIILVILSLVAGKWCPAQCDKKMQFVSEKQEMMTKDGVVEESRDEVVDIVTTKESITITPHGNDRPFSAKIKEVKCAWKKPYKEGRAEYKIAVLSDDGTEVSDGTIIMEASGDKLYFYVELPKFQGKRVRVTISSFEEKS